MNGSAVGAARTRSIVCALCAAFVLLACTDTGVIGSNSICAKPCPRDQLCHPSLATCVECIHDNDCAKSNDGKPRCDTRSICVECASPADCTADKPDCVQGECKIASDDHSHSSDDNAGTGDDHTSAGSGG